MLLWTSACFSHFVSALPVNNIIFPYPTSFHRMFYDTLLWHCFFSFPGCTYNHQHAAADPAAPASAVPGAADEAAAASLSFLLLFLLRWSASPWWPCRGPWLRQINPGPLHRPTPGSGPRRHTAHQRATVFAQRLQHLPSLWVWDGNFFGSHFCSNNVNVTKWSLFIENSNGLQALQGSYLLKHTSVLIPSGVATHSSYIHYVNEPTIQKHN